MDIAKIIYISLTMLTAWVFMDTAFPMDTYKHLLGVIGSYGKSTQSSPLNSQQFAPC